ncbi:MAG: divalent-cation tolerance protein CutA [Deltaproteobacteria bacterium]|jgi:periplasmic divalent cation tolerance protein|nr:divalent-cation tolerance protein CutA [Deltaproteobacteria bacterium]
MALFVYVTAPDAACAETIGRMLLERRLAACVNILPGVRSLYWWNGVIESDEEAAFIAKTEPDRFEALAEAVRAAHPYQCPCVVALPVDRATPDFLDWIVAATRPE